MRFREIFERAISMALDTTLTLILLLSALITAGLAVFALRRSEAPGALPLGLFLISLSVYAAGYAMELRSGTLAGISFWLRIEYIGIAFLPTLYIIAIIEITLKKRMRAPGVLFPLLFLSSLTLIFHYTNDYHHLFYRSISLVDSGPFPLAVLEKGPWYWVHIAYVNGSFFFSNILLARMLIGASPLYRRQALVLLAGSFIPWAGLTAYLMGQSPWGIDLNPFSLSLTGLILAFGLLRYRIVDIIPIAYDNLFMHLNDGVLILDSDKRVVFLNPAARDLLGVMESPVGEKAEKVLSCIEGEASGCLENRIIEMRADSGDVRWIDMRISHLQEKKDKVVGGLLTLRDITETREMEISIQDSEKRLRGELANVRNIQAAMLPDFSRVTDFDIASIFLPAEDLSGDFFDGYFIDEDVFQIVICDVMHHGMTSAYLGMEIRSLFRAYSGPEISPSRAIEAVNRKLCEDFSAIMYYATVAICQLRLKENSMVYSSGGHPPSLYLPAGAKAIRETGFTGALIGLKENNVYKEITVEMNAGDSMLLYTDGVTETRENGNGEMFGRKRLCERFIAADGSSRDIIHGLLENVFEYSDFTPLEDDMTMICVKRKG